VSGVQRFQCPSCKERKNTEEGDIELITTDGRIEEFDEFCYLGNLLDCEAGLKRAVRSSGVEKMLGDGEFDNKQK